MNVCVCVWRLDDTSYSLLSVSSLQLFRRGVFQYITLSHAHACTQRPSLLNKRYSELLGLQKLKLHSCTKTPASPTFLLPFLASFYSPPLSAFSFLSAIVCVFEVVSVIQLKINYNLAADLRKNQQTYLIFKVQPFLWILTISNPNRVRK